MGGWTSSWDVTEDESEHAERLAPAQWSLIQYVTVRGRRAQLHTNTGPSALAGLHTACALSPDTPWSAAQSRFKQYQTCRIIPAKAVKKRLDQRHGLT
ncbi:hypothetical protein VDGL01_10300 [Verticillium dahliae]